jgi:hypothetical protein
MSEATAPPPEGGGLAAGGRGGPRGAGAGLRGAPFAGRRLLDAAAGAAPAVLLFLVALLVYKPGAACC